MGDVRRAAVAGSWYPGSTVKLAVALEQHLLAVPRTRVPACPRALIAPHAGLVYSGPVAAHAYALVRHCGYSAVVLVGPSHFVGFEGISIWPRGSWDTPLGAVAVHEELAEAIAVESRDIQEYPAAHGREHSLEMQLPFLAHVLPGVPIVPLVMGYQTRATAESLGDAIARGISTHEARELSGVLLIASSDLSHYENADTAARMDDVVLRHLAAIDPDGLMAALEREPKHACGGGPMVSVLRAASQLGAAHAEILHYADSGDVSGDKSAVVGYTAAAIW
jgi:MEMO1 family protein